MITGEKIIKVFEITSSGMLESAIEKAQKSNKAVVLDFGSTNEPFNHHIYDVINGHVHYASSIRFINFDKDVHYQHIMKSHEKYLNGAISGYYQ